MTHKIITPEEAMKQARRYDLNRLVEDGFEPYDDKILEYRHQEVDIVLEDGELIVHAWMHDNEHFTGIGVMQGQWHKSEIKFIRLSVNRFQGAGTDERAVLYNHRTPVEWLEGLIHFAGTRKLRILTSEEMDHANREMRQPKWAWIKEPDDIRRYTKILGDAQRRRLRRAAKLSKQLNVQKEKK